ncbi:MAG: VOC family protein [Cyclobacteriaceae bacterium]|nr:VOC family protein [Cyclobacteriaceae bacterium]
MNAFLECKATIRTRDYTASCHFYQQILGLDLIESWQDAQDRGSIFRLDKRGGSLLEISELGTRHESYRAEFAQPATMKMDLQMATDDLQHWVEKLQGNWEFRGPVSRPWGSEYLYLKDPDGVQVIIYKYQNP